MSVKRVHLSVKNPARLAQTWVRQGARTDTGRGVPKADVFTARLTLDITAELRQNIKLAALSRGTTVAELLRGLLDREFGESPDPNP